ncbi:hypothetical protein VNO80_03158 [Phaseolus coccineus]|uniref:AAA+ ATPase domain-containing protein n=1 Tax=Phaseolus coccineus TaxID=3886 RepID=A0AAN9NRP8_PHACN
MVKFENNGFRTKRLLNYATDLTEMAIEGKLDPVIGRPKEIERIQQILCQRRKNSPCLLGGPGVGKTAIVEGLAQEIVNETVPLNLKGIKVFALEMGRLVARTRYRGDIEERLVEVIEEVKESDGEIILFIDDIHTLIGNGSFSRPLDVANVLKLALSGGDIKCIVATTDEALVAASSLSKKYIRLKVVDEISVIEVDIENAFGSLGMLNDLIIGNVLHNSRLEVFRII